MVNGKALHSVSITQPPRFPDQNRHNLVQTNQDNGMQTFNQIIATERRILINSSSYKFYLGYNFYLRLQKRIV